MIKILLYSFYDLMRSRWSIAYFAFYLILGFVLLFLNSDLSKAVLTMMNVVVILTPLIGIMFGVMYYYSSRDFIQLLLAQPLSRQDIFLGLFFGVSLSLGLSFLLGLGIPFLMYGVLVSGEIANLVTLLLTGLILTFISTSLAFWIALSNDNKIRGFGIALFTWLFLAVIYDGLFLMSLLIFEEYPLDNLSLVSVLLNPIDLSRILILLQLDVSALLGYTGAVFKQFFGETKGLVIASATLSLWVLIPTFFFRRKALRKDF